MKVSKQITIEWWADNDTGSTEDGEIKEAYKEELETKGFERATEMMQQGYHSGELNENIMLDIEGEPEDGESFSGWFTIKTIENPQE